MDPSWDAKNHHFSAPIWGIGLDFFPTTEEANLRPSDSKSNDQSAKLTFFENMWWDNFLGSCLFRKMALEQLGCCEFIKVLQMFFPAPSSRGAKKTA